ncbi:Transcription factor GT-2 [Handroanthus impetiginosus]|uniref:Transcription factor GT-2 n=1 Tax=Handroanthus impetiginosus TaxID=429701 RepID=A0A2G9GXE7_9LAMI|nr:Transcription factor GT-2 [Handroanthus impetiginosus]
MEDQYGNMADLRPYVGGRAFFPPMSRPPDFISGHPFDMLMFRPESTVIAPAVNTSGGASSSAVACGGCLSGFEMEGGGVSGTGVGGDGGTGRWPRQETLTLLEIRSRLDTKFKEANQKGPLWEEVSRIMSEEHGYQRTGKKCREKFENLYKYYKKTKEGKAGRQDGKHYRFFRQLEALYGETNNNNSEPHLVDHYNFPNNNVLLGNNNNNNNTNQESYPGSFDSSDRTISSDDHTNYDSKKKKRRSNLKAKIKDFIDARMRKMMEKQETWMENMIRTIEQKEQERILREEQWRKQDALRIERERNFWANERAWIEARDASLMDAFHKLKELRGSRECDVWAQSEISRLIQLRNGMEFKFDQESGSSEEGRVWEEIAAKMGCLGHERSGLKCKEKWDSLIDYIIKCNKKRKENNNQESVCDDNQGVGSVTYCETSDQQGIINSDSCLRYFNVGDSYGRY